MAVKNFTELIAWQKAMILVEEVYKITSHFPSDEKYGLTNQIRRASVSVPSNIAEGQGRGPNREFTHHLAIAYGSLCEVQTQIMIAARLGYVRDADIDRFLELTYEVARLVNGLSNSVSKK